MGRIENVTDQLHLFVDDVVKNVERLKKDYKFTTGEAIKIVEAGIYNMDCGTRWRELCDKEDGLIDATK